MVGNERFIELVQEFNGNRYMAVNYIVKLARKLTAKYNYMLLDSEAISWLLTGAQPKIVTYYYKSLHNKKSPQHAFIDDILCYVDDKGVSFCVNQSIQMSQKANHLIYIYTGVSDEHRQARIRVLTRIIWYNLHNYID